MNSAVLIRAELDGLRRLIESLEHGLVVMDNGVDVTAVQLRNTRDLVAHLEMTLFRVLQTIH